MIQPSFTSSPSIQTATHRRFNWRLILGVVALVGAGLLFVLGSQESPSGKPLLSVTGFKERVAALVNKNEQSGERPAGSSGTNSDVAGLTTEGSGETASEPLVAPLSGEAVLARINQYRSQNGLGPLVQEGRFCEWAFHRANVVASNWDQRAIVEKQDDVFKAVCPSCKSMGEALSRNFTSPEDILNDWLTSNDIKQNLLGPYNIGCVGTHIENGVNYVALEVGER